MGRGTSDNRKMRISDYYKKKAGKNRPQGYKQRVKRAHDRNQKK